MEAIFTYILKVNVLLILFYLIYKLALSKETFYEYSRWFLLSGIVISVLLPFVTFTKIEYYEVKKVFANQVENTTPKIVSISNEALAQEPVFSTQELLFYAYGIITFLFLLKTFLDVFKLIKIIKVSDLEKRNQFVYINTSLVNTPFSFFNYIVYNSELINPTELQNIMKHEEAHSLQKHSFDTLLAQFLVVLFWFNPIVWLYRICIVQNLEFLADSHAITQVSDKAYYQKTMLKMTLQPQSITIINTFNQSSIKKRIIMLNTNQSNKKHIWKFGIVIPFVTLFMLFFQVETIAQEKLSKNKKQEIKVDSILFKEKLASKSKSVTNDNLKGFDKVEITFKDNKTISKFSNKSEVPTISENENPLYIINGKEMRLSEIKHKGMTIEGDIDHYEGVSAIEKFGEKGKDGVFVLNGKTIFTDDAKLLKAIPENPENKYFELANGNVCVLFNGFMLKIPDFPSINLSISNNKVFIDDKQYHKDMFYNFDHKNLKTVSVLKIFKDDEQIGYSVYFTTK